MLRRDIAVVARRPLYVGLSLLMVLIAFAGFAPQSIRELIGGNLPPYAVVHLHALIYFGWLALFFLQAFLATSGRVEEHLKVGDFLVGYGVLVFVSGMSVAINRYIYLMHEGYARSASIQTYFAFVDMFAFAASFTAAFLLRKWPEAHKRMMVNTTTILLYPALTRLAKTLPLIMYPRIFDIRVVFMLVWSAPISISIIHDLLSRRRVHPASIAGMISLLLLSERDVFADSALWVGFTHWLDQFI